MLYINRLTSHVGVARLVHVPSRLRGTAFQHSRRCIRLPVRAVLALHTNRHCVNYRAGVVGGTSRRQLHLLVPDKVSNRACHASRTFYFLRQPHNMSFSKLGNHRYRCPRGGADNVVSLNSLTFVNKTNVHRTNICPSKAVSTALLQDIDGVFRRPRTGSTGLLNRRACHCTVTINSGPSRLYTVVRGLGATPVAFATVNAHSLPRVLRDTLSLASRHVHLSAIGPYRSSSKFVIHLCGYAGRAIAASLGLHRKLSTRFIHVSRAPLTGPAPFSNGLALHTFRVIALHVDFWTAPPRLGGVITSSGSATGRIAISGVPLVP